MSILTQTDFRTRDFLSQLCERGETFFADCGMARELEHRKKRFADLTKGAFQGTVANTTLWHATL
jgi:hypothetical protein